MNVYMYKIDEDIKVAVAASLKQLSLRGVPDRKTDALDGLLELGTERDLELVALLEAAGLAVRSDRHLCGAVQRKERVFCTRVQF